MNKEFLQPSALSHNTPATISSAIYERPFSEAESSANAKKLLAEAEKICEETKSLKEKRFLNKFLQAFYGFLIGLGIGIVIGVGFDVWSY